MKLVELLEGLALKYRRLPEMTKFDKKSFQISKYIPKTLRSRKLFRQSLTMYLEDRSDIELKDARDFMMEHGDTTKYNEALFHLSQHRFPLTVYRCIKANSIDDVIDGTWGPYWSGVGAYWTPHFRSAECYDARGAGDEMIFKAVIKPININWIDTMISRLWYGSHENEITLKKNIPITITGVYNKETGEWTHIKKEAET